MTCVSNQTILTFPRLLPKEPNHFPITYLLCPTDKQHAGHVYLESHT